MDEITLQQEIEKIKLDPNFAHLSNEEIRRLIFQEAYDRDGDGISSPVTPLPEPEPQAQQIAFDTDMSWDNPYEYQGPTNIMEDAQSAIGTGQQLYKGAQTIFGKEKVADFTGKIKNMFAPVGTAVPMLKGATMTKAATFANVSNPAMMSSAGGTGALAGLGPLAAVAAGVYLLDKNKRKKREAKRRKRMEQYQDFRETERNKLREGQQDYFEMAGKYSNPYNV